MPRRGSVGAFSLPSQSVCLSPSGLTERLVRQGQISAFLGGAVLASLLASLSLTYLTIRRAEVIPFAADGGIFGCQLRTLTPPSVETPR